jgi:hypothetical protein
MSNTVMKKLWLIAVYCGLLKESYGALFKMVSADRCVRSASRLLKTVRLVNELHCASTCSNLAGCAMYIVVVSTQNCELYKSISGMPTTTLEYCRYTSLAGTCKQTQKCIGSICFKTALVAKYSSTKAHLTRLTEQYASFIS